MIMTRDSRCTDRRPRNQIMSFADDTNFFCGDINSFVKLKPILILYEKAANPKMNFSKNSGILSYKAVLEKSHS